MSLIESLDYSVCPFSELTLQQLYRIIQLREQVFVVDQKCSYLDCDGVDLRAHHIFGTRDGKIVSYLRVCPPGEPYAERSIGRVLTAPEVRGQGLGKELMLKAISWIFQTYSDEPFKLSAQSHLERFYTELGFQTYGEPYLDVGIPHIAMLYRSSL